jgi:hypothetical protein
MAPSRESSQERHRNDDFAGAVRIPWFRSIHATFAVSCVTKPITKFYSGIPELPSTLVDTIGPLCDDPSASPTHTPSYSL